VNCPPAGLTWRNAELKTSTVPLPKSAAKLGDLYKPKSFSVVGALPRTAVGKIDKRALQDAYLAEPRPA